MSGRRNDVGMGQGDRTWLHTFALSRSPEVNEAANMA